MEKIENSIENVGEIEGSDITLTPSYYIHQAILKAQVALTKDNLEEGLVQYRLLVEHIESIAKSAKMLELDSYNNKISEFSENLKDEGMIRSAKIAHYKLELLLGAILEGTPKTSTLSVKP